MFQLRDTESSSPNLMDGLGCISEEYGGTGGIAEDTEKAGRPCLQLYQYNDSTPLHQLDKLRNSDAGWHLPILH